MAQFDVFANPVARARRAYPYVVVLQADVAQLGRDRAVAPAAPYAVFPAIAGRLTPVVTIEQDDFEPTRRAQPVRVVGLDDQPEQRSIGGVGGVGANGHGLGRVKRIVLYDHYGPRH